MSRIFIPFIFILNLCACAPSTDPELQAEIMKKIEEKSDRIFPSKSDRRLDAKRVASTHT